jgi:DNA-binding IclR family transcriptional regulator
MRGSNSGQTSHSAARQVPLERYFTILEKVAAHPGLSAGDLAELCALPFPTVHRLIGGLRKAGLLTGGERRKGYELGTRLLRLVQSGSDDSWIRITAQRKLDELAEKLGETCYMAKLIDDRVVSVAWATPTDGLRGHVIPGLSQPLHAAACAKAILAHQPEAFVRSLLRDPLPKLCTNTKTDVEEILAVMNSVRDQGFATCVNENELGVAAIACPISVAGVGVIYSIGVMALCDRLPDKRFPHLASVLDAAAAELAVGVKSPLRAG